MIGRIAGDDAIEILRIALGFHQRFAPAVGAALEIGEFRRRARIGADDRLGGVGGFLEGAIAEVDLLFGMVQRPAGIGADGGLMAVIGGGDGATLRQAEQKRPAPE